MKILIDLPEIEGFEYTGEYREPKGGEPFMMEGEGKLNASTNGVCLHEHHILKRLVNRTHRANGAGLGLRKQLDEAIPTPQEYESFNPVNIIKLKAFLSNIVDILEPKQ